MASTTPATTGLAFSGRPATTDHVKRAQTLWDQALNTLNAETRQLIDFGQPSKRDVIEDVLRLAEEKKQLCIRSRWKIAQRNGEYIVFRDVFDKVATFARKFREIGDAAVQYDPAHAALPWAGIRLVLQIVINDTSAFAAMMNGLEIAAACIDRYAIVEELYLRETSIATLHLSTSLIGVYASVLSFLGKSIRFFSDMKAKRLLKNSLGLEDSTIESLVEDMAVKQSLVERDALLVQGVRQLGLVDITGLLATKLSKVDNIVTRDYLDVHHANILTESIRTRTDLSKIMSLASDLSKPLHRTAHSLQELVDDRTAAERLQILKWVSTIPYSQHHNNIRKDRIPGTSRWLLHTPQLQRWSFSSCSSTLWVHGIPGSGKTFLASTLIDELLEQTKGGMAAPLSYFYCNRNSAEPERSDSAEVLASIARQLSASDSSLPIRRPLIDKYGAIKGRGFDLRRMDVEELLDLIIELCHDNPAVIVVDALDEVDPITRYQLIEGFDRVIRESTNVVKLFITSREDHDIACRLESGPNLYITAEDNDADIRKFIEVELFLAILQKRLLRGEVSASLQNDIRRTLEHGAQGMFRWVSLQLQNLCNPQRMKIEADVVAELGRLPKTLSDIYNVIYNQILQSGTMSKALAERALQWLLVTQRPLTPNELAAGILMTEHQHPISFKAKDLLSLTCNFLVIDNSLEIVRFAHTSVREYLEKRPEYTQDECNTQVSGACLKDYQNLCQVKDGEWDSLSQDSISLSHVLRPYSCQFWPVHTTKIRDPKLRVKLMAILKSSFFNDLYPTIGFLEWRKHIDVHPTEIGWLKMALAAATTPFRLCCLFGFHEILNACTSDELKRHNGKTSFNSSALDYVGTTGFHMAIINGHENVVKRLLLSGISANDTTASGQTPAYLAASNEQSHLLPLLAEFGADIDKTVPLLRTMNYEPGVSLHIVQHGASGLKPFEEFNRVSATRLGQRNSNGRATSAIDEEEAAPLHHVVTRGFTDCVIELLNLGASVDVSDNMGHTPLLKAQERRRYGIMQLLLERGADPNKQFAHGRSAIHLATAVDDIQAVRLLLSYGADPGLTDALGMTASSIAFRHGHTDIARLLPPPGPLRETLGAYYSTEEEEGDGDPNDSEPQGALETNSAGHSQTATKLKSVVETSHLVVSEWQLLTKNAFPRESVVNPQLPHEPKLAKRKILPLRSRRDKEASTEQTAEEGDPQAKRWQRGSA